ncbi:MAG TPA: hypothetical protein VIZ61_13575 [Solirubrobacterales bacterium]
MMYYKTPQATESGPIVIRPAGATDEDAVRLVAQRDSRAVPEGELLIAAVGGEVRAAISLSTGQVIADPFQRTEELVRVLALRRAQLRHELRRPNRGLRRLRLTAHPSLRLTAPPE